MQPCTLQPCAVHTLCACQQSYEAVCVLSRRVLGTWLTLSPTPTRGRVAFELCAEFLSPGLMCDVDGAIETLQLATVLLMCGEDLCFDLCAPVVHRLSRVRVRVRYGAGTVGLSCRVASTRPSIVYTEYNTD